MSQSGKLMPNLDEKSTKLLNLTVLQRADPFVEEILMTAAHVALYEFNIDAGQWSRKNVEGSLFVVKRNAQPQFQFIVMNRRSTDNLVENLLGNFEYEVKVPYLFYRNASQEVTGIWFYNAHECEEAANLFSRILNAYSQVPRKSKVSPAKSEFEELESVSTLKVVDSSLKPSCCPTYNVADVLHDQSFVNFSSTAMNIGTSPHVVISGPPHHTSASVVFAHSHSVTLPTFPPTQAPASSTSTPIMSILENHEPNTALKHTTDLVKPSSFSGPPVSSPVIMPPVTSYVPTAPLNLSGNQKRPYGAPLLQPFPPPTPAPSLAPNSVPTPNYGPVISREKVREALQLLVQDNQFIDIIYQAVVNAHRT